eukprot:scaffold7092_cov262-Pinguiococcus_pyrenoidosus.AAC.4
MDAIKKENHILLRNMSVIVSNVSNSASAGGATNLVYGFTPIGIPSTWAFFARFAEAEEPQQRRAEARAAAHSPR